MRKKILCLVMGLMMVMGTSLTAFAEDYQGASGWLADFDGDSINSNFATADIADQMNGILPGDSIELNVSVRNSDDRTTDWYMTNEVVQTLEDARASASGGAYEYRLTYTDGSGTQTVLFDSSTVGGEDLTGGEGLHQVDGSTQEYFYLERLGEGETGRVTLWLRVDGETQGNGYQLTLAELRLNFAVEVVPNAAVRTETNHEVQVVSPGSVVQTVTTVKTGDAARLLLWSALALGCGAVLLVSGILLIKRREKKGE